MGKAVEPGLSISESQEQINGTDGIALKIYQKNEVMITTDDAGSDGRVSSPTNQHRHVDGVFPGSGSPTANIPGDKLASENDMGFVTKVFHGVQ